VLGWGGQGFVSLFRDPNTLTYYVLKSAIDARRWHELRDERDRLKVSSLTAKTAGVFSNLIQDYAQARHIVQLTQPPTTNLGTLRCYIMEYLRGGNLEHMIIRAVARHEHIRNKTLWLILEHLFRAVVALRYPPRKWSDFDERLPYGTTRNEVVPTAAQMAPQFQPLFLLLPNGQNGAQLPLTLPGVPPSYMPNHMFMGEYLNLDITPNNCKPEGTPSLISHAC
jgi:hypothetical protein